MPEDCCPLCQGTLEYRESRGLERRRHPKGRWACPHELTRWHLRLEALARDLDLARDPRLRTSLQAEFDDILVQHMPSRPAAAPEPA
jgi:uncharacterized protein YbaR (Trm112 family)